MSLEHLTDQQLIDRINTAEPFKYDDEQVELNRRLGARALAWKWSIIDGREQVEIYEEVVAPEARNV